MTNQITIDIPDGWVFKNKSFKVDKGQYYIGSCGDVLCANSTLSYSGFFVIVEKVKPKCKVYEFVGRRKATYGDIAEDNYGNLTKWTRNSVSISEYNIYKEVTDETNN